MAESPHAEPAKQAAPERAERARERPDEPSTTLMLRAVAPTFQGGRIDPRGLTPQAILALQRTAGNHAVNALLCAYAARQVGDRYVDDGRHASASRAEVGLAAQPAGTAVGARPGLVADHALDSETDGPDPEARRTRTATPAGGAAGEESGPPGSEPSGGGAPPDTGTSRSGTRTVVASSMIARAAATQAMVQRRGLPRAAEVGPDSGLVQVRAAVGREDGPLRPHGLVAPLAARAGGLPATQVQRVPRDSWPDATRARRGRRPGWNTGASTIETVLRIPLANLTVGGPAGDLNVTSADGTRRTTTEQSNRRAIVLLPERLIREPALLAQPVQIWLHFHGLGLGYRQDDLGMVGDVFSDFEQQLAGSHQLIIGILAQGDTHSRFGGATRDPGQYIDGVLTALQSTAHLARVPVRGPIMLSAHSGGGTETTALLAATRRLPAELREVVLFDAINQYRDSQEYAHTRIWLQQQIQSDVDALLALPAARRLDYLAHSLRFRGYHTEMPGYRADYVRLDGEMQGWLGAAASRLGGANPVTQALRANYQIIAVGHSDHKHMLTMARGGHMREALTLLPTEIQTAQAARAEGAQPVTGAGGTAEVPGQQAGPGSSATVGRQVTDTPVARRSVAGSGMHGRPISRPLVQRNPPRGPGMLLPAHGFEATPGLAGEDGRPLWMSSADIAPEQAIQLLVEATVASGRADTEPPVDGHSLLRRDDIRATLAARAGDSELSSLFDAAVHDVVVAAAADRGDRVSAHARDLLLLLENRFIHDPTRSALDLLPPDRARHYEQMHWDVNDYPGHHRGEPPGPHEDEARAMTAAMTRVRPERRPNAGRTSVLTRDQATPARWRYIRSQLAPVEGQPGHQLHHEAATAFATLTRMAEHDHVTLVIVASYRTPETAIRNAARADNANSTASFSSHSLGLAVDLRMSDAHHHYRETETHPMQSVVDMRMSTAHKWMVLRGAQFGWFPFGDEPWHWEYNPPGFRQQFWADGGAVAPPNGHQPDDGTPGH